MRKLKTIEIERLSVEEFHESRKMPLVVVLDDVRSLHNVGSVFRTADAFAVSAVYLCGITAQPPMPEIHKTALGAEDSVEWRYFKTTQEAVNHLQEKISSSMPSSNAKAARCSMTLMSVLFPETLQSVVSLSSWATR